VRIVDVNVLLYAVNGESPHHRESRRWLDGALSGSETIGFAWVVLLGFLRLSTSGRVFPRPLELASARDLVESWLDQPPALVVHPSNRHLALMGGLLATTGAAGNLVNDAHLAALALEHDAVIVSYDGDFERFAGVRREPPGP
jgi:toxin-antitoxin system PIN domain toxin